MATMAHFDTETELAALKQRQNGAMEKLIREHTPALLAAGFAMGFSQADAEELAQETFSAFLEALERFEGHSQLKTYLFGILYNKAADWRRKRRKEESLDASVEEEFEKRFNAAGMWSAPPKGPEELALNAEMQALIEQCAQGLSASQRTAFFLKEAEGESAEEICNVLGVSYTNLRVLMYRARIKLRECLERNWEKRS
ncbi:MAG TPA: sigma-70 family RNA polymerase sigma factor [Elusimicrobiota bacterium]|nr:sigma-70 family RNA polymerase sigma factor [Elusimicrobiota bacterium]